MASIFSNHFRSIAGSLTILCSLTISAQSIDISQMVNPATGDLNYSLPIMEVPGPEGGFPLVLNYSAGIRLEQEPSWVGLGWGLDAGSISRSVVRFPDDYKGGIVNLKQTDPGDCQSKDVPANFFETLAYIWVDFIADVFYNVDLNEQKESSSPGIWDWRITTSTDTDKFLGFPYDKDITVCWELEKDHDEYGYGFLYQSELVENTASGQTSYTLPLTRTVEYNGRVYESYYSIDSFNQASDYIQPREEDALLYENLNPLYWATDNYAISAGSLRGSLSPIRFDNPSIASSYNSNKYYPDQVAVKKIQVVPEITTKPQFVFSSEQSNKYDYLKSASTDFDFDYGLTTLYDNEGSPEVTAVPNSTQSPGLGTVEADRVGFENGILRRGNVIKWYSNEEISNGTATADGFMNYTSDLSRIDSENGENSNYYPAEGIGGFKVIDMNGVTYHFSIPVYVLSHKNTFVVDQFESIESYKEPYATQWLLTAITGSDFKDVGSTSGVVDTNDKGYFVIFNYGKFSDYRKSNIPKEGMNRFDPENENALSKVELITQDYYLDEIKTRTHTAVFSKKRGYLDRLYLDEIILFSNKEYDVISGYKNSTNKTGFFNFEYPRNVWLSEDIEAADHYVPDSRIQSVTIVSGQYLSSVEMYGANKETKVPSYDFEYYLHKDGGFTTDYFIEYDIENYNAWGYFNDYDGVDNPSREEINIGEAKAFSLRTISTPNNEQVTINYEPDEYSSISGIELFIDRQAGSIRVSDITIEDNLSGNSYTTTYDYTLENGRSSGVATKEPQLGKFDIEEYEFEDIHGYLSEGVYYSRVKQTNKVNGNSLGGTIYEFHTPDQNMISLNTLHTSSYTQNDEIPSDGFSTDYEINQRAYETVYDFGLVTKPISMLSFDTQGAYLSEIKYFYEDCEQGEISQGLHLMDETYRNYDQRYSGDERNDRKRTARFINSISTYKQKRLAKVETFNFVSNQQTTVYNGSYDFITGQPEKNITVTENRTILKESTPAYKISSYNSNINTTGMDYADVGGKNILSQSAYSSAYLIDPVVEPINFNSLTKRSLLNASAQTWDYDGNTWLPEISYSHVSENLNSDGTLPLLSAEEEFDFSASSQSENWFYTSTNTMRNDFSSVIESVDINNNYTTQKLSTDESQLLISAQNARHNEIAFSGAEVSWKNSNLNSDVAHNDGIVTSSQVHTGNSSLRLPGGTKGFEYSTIIDEELNGKTIEVAFWFYKGTVSLANIELRYSIGSNSYTIDASADMVRVGNWRLFKQSILINTATPDGSESLNFSVHNASTGTIYVDDFRVAPFDAPIECYVYDNYGNVTFILDNNHFYTQRVYDVNHNVVEVRREHEGGVYTVEKSDFRYSKAINVD